MITAKKSKKSEQAAPVNTLAMPASLKRFMVLGYRMQNGRIRLANCDSKEEGYETKDAAMEFARSQVQRYSTGGAAHYAVDGLLVFETISVVRPKPVELEIETLPLV